MPSVCSTLQLKGVRMIPDLMRKAKNLLRRSDKLCASVPQGKVDEIEKEIACLKGEHREMSAKVFA